MGFQLGSYARDPEAFRAKCDCRLARPPPKRPSDVDLAKATAAAAKRDAKACARGDHLACVKSEDNLTVKAESIIAISRAMTTHDALYAHALDVFYARVLVAEAAVGVPLLTDCGEEIRPENRASWNEATGDQPPTWNRTPPFEAQYWNATGRRPPRDAGPPAPKQLG